MITKYVQKVLPFIISVNQSAYVNGRFIHDALRTIADVMNYREDKNLSSILVCLDFEKAFDSISWNFLNRVLKYFNFGNGLQKWVKLFYTQIESAIINNGYCSRYFDIHRGVRQGDPLSAYLFILVTELLT
mgnify:FL=1